MNNKFHLSQEDVGEIVRLVGEAVIMDGDNVARKRRVMDGVAAMIDADSWFWTISKVTPEPPYFTNVSFMHNGLDDAQLSAVAKQIYDKDRPIPIATQIIEMMKQRKRRTFRWNDIFDDDTHCNSPSIQMYGKSTNIDSDIVFLSPLRDDMFSLAGLHRGWGRPQFSIRDRQLVNIMTSEIDFLHTAELPSEEALRGALLSPRLQQVQLLLLEGMAVKQIAYQLGLSENMARDYTKALYRHYDVSSRSELFHRFISRDAN